MDNFLEKFGHEWEVDWLKTALLATREQEKPMWGMSHEHQEPQASGRETRPGSEHGQEQGREGITRRAEDEKWLNMD